MVSCYGKAGECKDNKNTCDQDRDTILGKVIIKPICHTFYIVIITDMSGARNTKAPMRMLLCFGYNLIKY